MFQPFLKSVRLGKKNLAEVDISVRDLTALTKIEPNPIQASYETIELSHYNLNELEGVDVNIY